METEGVSCHSSNPDKGVNAVYHMMAVIEEIRRIIPNEHPILGKGILELTDIISSPYPGASVVPALCRATLRPADPDRGERGRDSRPGGGGNRRAREKIPGLKARDLSGRGEGGLLDRGGHRREAVFPGVAH